jgi:hypothetical protein
LLHQVLVTLGDDEVALRMAVTTTVLVSDEVRRGSEELRLRERGHIGEDEVVPGAPESPCAASYARAANSGVSYVPRVSRKPPA